MKNFHVLSESKQKKIIAYASIKVSKRSDVCAHFAPLIVDHVNSNNFCSQTMRSSAEFPTVIVYFVTLKRNGFTEYPSCHDYIQRHCPNVWLRKTAEKHRWVLRVLSDLLYYKTPAELIPNLILDSLIQISGSHIRYWIKFCWCYSSVVMDNSRGERLHSEFHSSAKYLDFQATTVMIRVTLLYRRGSIIYIYIYIYIYLKVEPINTT